MRYRYKNFNRAISYEGSLNSLTSIVSEAQENSFHGFIQFVKEVAFKKVDGKFIPERNLLEVRYQEQSAAGVEEKTENIPLIDLVEPPFLSVPKASFKYAINVLDVDSEEEVIWSQMHSGRRGPGNGSSGLTIELEMESELIPVQESGDDDA